MFVSPEFRFWVLAAQPLRVRDSINPNSDYLIVIDFTGAAKHVLSPIQINGL